MIASVKDFLTKKMKKNGIVKHLKLKYEVQQKNR